MQAGTHLFVVPTAEQNTDSESVQPTTQHLINTENISVSGDPGYNVIEHTRQFFKAVFETWNDCDVMAHSPTLTQRDPFFSNATSRGVFLLKD